MDNRSIRGGAWVGRGTDGGGGGGDGRVCGWCSGMV